MKWLFLRVYEDWSTRRRYLSQQKCVTGLDCTAAYCRSGDTPLNTQQFLSKEKERELLMCVHVRWAASISYFALVPTVSRSVSTLN
jgi:hypothetical protein